MVRKLRKASAVAVAPTVVPRKMTTMLFSSFWAAFDRRSTPPLSFIRLPSIRQPISVAAEGRIRLTMMATTMGKMIFSFFDTVRN